MAESPESESDASSGNESKSVSENSSTLTSSNSDDFIFSSNSIESSSNKESTFSNSRDMLIEKSRERIARLGDIYSYPVNVADAEKRMKIALKAYKDSILTYEDRSIVRREIQKNKDVIEWCTGYSNLKDTPDGEENYFRFCIPGADVKRWTKEKEVAIGRRYTEREYCFDKKDKKRVDLVRNYRYNDRMIDRKMKIYLEMNIAIENLTSMFKTYGKKARFKIKDPDNANNRIVDYNHLGVLIKGAKRFLKEFEYIYQVKTMRSPFGISYANNFRGVYKRVIMNEKLKTWLGNEAMLRGVRKELNRESFLMRGMTTYYTLDTLFRTCMYGDIIRKDNVSFYNTTEGMQTLLEFPKQIRVLNITTFIRQHLLKVKEINKLSSDYRGFLVDIYVTNDANSGQSKKNFISELNFVQIYADLEYQKVYEARKAVRKVLTNEEKKIKQRRAREIKRAKDVRQARLDELCCNTTETDSELCCDSY